MMGNFTIYIAYLILLGRMILARHVACIGDSRRAYKIFIGKP
jgi:hypothetical protein